MSLSFHENFWGKNGFDVINSHLEQGKESLKLFSTLMTERSNIEKKYVQSLELLHKQSSKLADYPGFEGVINLFRNSIEYTMSIHSALVPVLKDEIGSFVESFKEEQKKRRKMMLAEASKLNSELKSLESQNAKLKEKYHKLAKENETNQDNSKKAKPKDQIKAQQKAAKSQMDMEKSESEYRDHIMKIISFLPNWETQIESALKDLQQQEEERIQFLKQQFVKYGHSLHQIEPVTMSPQIIQQAESINVESEITRFVREKQTGTIRPSPPDFEPFGDVPISLAPKSQSTPSYSAPPPSSSMTSSTNSAQFNPSFPPHSSSMTNPSFSQQQPQGGFNPSFPPPNASMYQPPPQQEQIQYQQPNSSISPRNVGVSGTGPVGGGGPALPRRAAPPPPSPSPHVARCRALYDYPAGDVNELSLKAGQIIPVLEKDASGWWTGEVDGKIGLFPSNYTEEI